MGKIIKIRRKWEGMKIRRTWGRNNAGVISTIFNMHICMKCYASYFFKKSFDLLTLVIVQILDSQIFSCLIIFWRERLPLIQKNYYPKIKNSWQSNKENENSFTSISVNFQSALFLESYNECLNSCDEK